MRNGLGLAVWMAHRNSAHAHAKPGRQNGMKTIHSGSARCYKAKASSSLMDFVFSPAVAVGSNDSTKFIYSLRIEMSFLGGGG
jgi:hypothetical protein